MFQLHTQYVDAASGFHVIELRDEKGTAHVIQIAVGHASCPACGHVTPKDNLGEIDPKAVVAKVNAALDRSQQNLLTYARKHNLKIR
ncbi:MAG TPA: hypothetical protein VGR96_09730 [Acidobacteriaceae bacterium]|nr:hypothetical protein [Acidobacteriaceae bacterium]